MSTNNTKIISFLDNIGRIIIGKKTDENEQTVSVENPVLVHIQPNQQTNQLQLQLLPLFFREFQTNSSKETVWHFNKTSITLSDDIDFNPQFLAQYQQTFGGGLAPQQAPSTEPQVVKLFDE